MGLGSFIRQALGGKRALSGAEISYLAEFYSQLVSVSLTDGGDLVDTKDQIHFLLYNEGTGILLRDENAAFEDTLRQSQYVLRAAVLLFTGIMDIATTSGYSDNVSKKALFAEEFLKGLEKQSRTWGDSDGSEWDFEKFGDNLSAMVTTIPLNPPKGNRVLKFSEEYPIDIEFVNQTLDDSIERAMDAAMFEAACQNDYFGDCVKEENIHYLKSRLGVDVSRLALMAHNALRQTRK